MQDVTAGQNRIRGLSAIEYPTGHGVQAVAVADLVTTEPSNGDLVREALADALAALSSGQIIGLVDSVECERIEHQADAHDDYLMRRAPIGDLADLLTREQCVAGLVNESAIGVAHMRRLAAALGGTEGAEVAA